MPTGTEEPRFQEGTYTGCSCGRPDARKNPGDYVARCSVCGRYYTVQVTGENAQYNRAVAVTRNANSVNIPLLKAALNIPWIEAAQLVSLMEVRGVIGPFDGMKPREIRAVES